jgi:hypothetical protein
MKDLDTVNYFEPAEKLVDILCKKTQNSNPLFFRILVAYYLAKIASMMRTDIKTHDRGVIPVSLYAINLAVSGAGKGHATNIVEESVIHKFKQRFLEETFPIISQTNLAKLANKRAAKKSADPDEELEKVEREFNNLGQLAFSFDSGTPAAIKQMRHKLLMSDCGSINLEMDEMASNLLGNVDVLTTFLELFDKGKIKQKLTKNTTENTRSEEIDGQTPTNLMLFGTPSKLLNGTKVEDEFFSMLDVGYARRCLFGYVRSADKRTDLTPEEIYDLLTDNATEDYLEDFSDYLANLADMANFRRTILIDRTVSLLLIEYKLQCEKLAEDFPEHEDIRKAELSHRYFKALKLAGTYAFIDTSSHITEDHLYSAIKLVEDSGEAFESIFTRDRNYVKLAKYIASVKREVTHVDLVEDLPFYKGSESQKRELMGLAIAYGYKNNIIIKRQFNDGIEFLRGESLQETDVNKLIISHSADLAYNYSNDYAPFDKLHKLTQISSYNWTNHHLLNGHRNEENSIQGFNLVVIDVDEGTSVDTARLLLKEYKYHIYTTKSHTPTKNRFRIVMPLSHTLKLDAKDFKEFMNNVYEWLPFSVDAQTNQRSRKWSSNSNTYYDNDGQLLNALLFIPKTAKNEERKQRIQDQQSLTNLERWFVNNTGSGNRSNQLIKYALLLVDSGLDTEAVKNSVLALNNKIPDKMEEAEIFSTILVTAGKAIYKRDSSSY